MSHYTNLTYINGIGSKKAFALKEAGFESFGDIASASCEDIQAIKGFSKKSAKKLIQRVKALVEQRIIPIHPIQSFPKREQLILFDIETDLNTSYIWAICAVLPDGTVKQWYAPTRKESPRIVKEFDEWLNEKIKTFDEPTLGSWSAFDFRVLEKIGQDKLRETFQQITVIDCLKEVRNHFAFPTSSFNLKEVSAYLGYQYDEQDIDGMLAASLYMQFQQRGGMPENLEKKLLQYNTDDVLAMWLVLDETFYKKPNE